MNKGKITALALFSGGLDSILACRVVADQGINVRAIKFVSSFFDYHLLEREDQYREKIQRKFGVDVCLRDISEEYIELLRNPVHGYGKYFNPCVDCKIFMVSMARSLMDEFNASFLISGEVLGQRPMSQRRDTLRIIERDGGCNATRDMGGILLRPLCAKNLNPTMPEQEGMVDRESLLGFSGRSRTPQMELAKKLNITGYPSPAGGCILTDPVIGERIKSFYKMHTKVTVKDMCYIQTGRQFRLPNGAWLIMGRKKAENDTLESLIGPGDIALKLSERPGPFAVVRYVSDRKDLELAAGLVARYGKKDNDGMPQKGLVSCGNGFLEEIVEGVPLDDDTIKDWLW